MDLLEPIGALLGLISVYLVVRRNILAFPIGIVSVSLYVVVFGQARFYADMVLQVVYIVMQIQGWYLWATGSKADDTKISVRRLSVNQWYWTFFWLAAGAIPAGYLLRRYTDAALPLVDAFTTVMSLLAQWWMNKKYLENWVLWIVVDFVYLFQYSYKALYYTTALYAAFFVLAIIGYRQWKLAASLNR